MLFEDVVLYNDCGCELDRQSITEGRDYYSIVKSWIIYPGDRIEIEETWHEIYGGQKNESKS